MSNVFDGLLDKAKKSGKTIVLTETEDERILEATKKATNLGICNIVLLTKSEDLSKVFNDDELNGIEIIDIDKPSEKKTAYANKLYELRKEKGMTEDQANEQVNSKLVYAMLMVKFGDADGVVSGAINHTADVLRPAFQIVKMKPGISKVSSIFVMESPSEEYGENGFLVFGDCGVNPNPTAEELAEIAIVSSETAKTLCGFEPKVALLSYSSASGDEMNDENVIKVKNALKIAKEKMPDLMIDGELQADASLVPSVAKLKAPSSPLKGKANVLIFPDLNAGNIAYKLVQRLAGVKAVGPILQGLNAPVNDLSRGTNSDEIVLDIAITVLQAMAK